MKEIRDIINAFDNACSEGKQSALATVVHVEGSSYRRPGARMLITEDGELTGAISGG
ncbi:MAG TPA: XdhC family protein, partial [Chitinophagaceae bacterium]|nr:XdhC family protein [Chitinophagaceae bacterium]